MWVDAGKGQVQGDLWWNDEVAKAVEEKKAWFAIWKETGDEGDHELYRSVKRALRRIVWEVQETKRRELIEELARGRREQTFFKIARQMVRSCVDVTGPTCMKDERGNIVVEDTTVKEVWRRHME